MRQKNSTTDSGRGKDPLVPKVASYGGWPVMAVYSGVQPTGVNWYCPFCKGWHGHGADDPLYDVWPGSFRTLPCWHWPEGGWIFLIGPLPQWARRRNGDARMRFSDDEVSRLYGPVVDRSPFNEAVWASIGRAPFTLFNEELWWRNTPIGKGTQPRELPARLAAAFRKAREMRR